MGQPEKDAPTKEQATTPDGICPVCRAEALIYHYPTAPAGMTGEAAEEWESKQAPLGAFCQVCYWFDE